MPVLSESFEISQLEGRAREAALDEVRQWQCEDSDWYDFVFEDAQHMGECLGIEIEVRNKRVQINFDGVAWGYLWASYSGRYSFVVPTVHKEAPQDEELHRIGDTLLVTATTFKLEGREIPTITICTYGLNGSLMTFDADNEALDDFEQPLKDFAHWIAKQLQAEYEYRTSDEAVLEIIETNDYRFDEDGRII